MKNYILLIIALLASRPLFAQQVSQTIRGIVRDEVAQSPIFGATVLLIQDTSKSPIGAITDAKGEFQISSVPIGIHSFLVTSIGYEENRLFSIIVTAGKEVIVNVTLTEMVRSLDEVIVTGDRKSDKAKTNNELALAGGRSFNIEDTKKYAGSLGDPSRMAANFAGVVSGNDSRNDIVVRGNSPAGMLWQLEGLNIPNPNHFGSLGSTGGPVSLLNNNTLDKSDFISSAFPSQYGNALSGVFDLRMREGNNQKYEFIGQAGFSGFELGAEGPLSKTSEASYLVNYRYSTLGLFKILDIQFGTGNAIPNYHDLNFKLVVPTSKKGKFTVLGIFGRSDVAFLGNDVDTTDTNLYGNENVNMRVEYRTNILGISYGHNLSKNTFAKLTLGTSNTDQNFNGDSISVITREAFASGESRFKTRKTSVVFNLRHKVSSKHSIYAGLTSDLLHFDLYSREIFNAGKLDTVRVNVNGKNTVTTQAYGQWKYRVTNNLQMTAGLHAQHFSLNNSFAIEPRFGLRYSFGNGQSVSMGYGLNSQTQNIYTYFIQTETEGRFTYTNKNIGFTRSHHLSLGYENRLAENLLLKVEPYYQSLYDVPVEKRSSSFSMLNTGSTFAIDEQDSLVNEGTGRNIGIEMTLEKYFSHGYYFLVTTSLFDSKYKGSDHVERNTAFNSRYVVNLLAGREVKVGRSRSSVLSASIKASFVGGKYVSPLDLEASRRRGKAVYNESKAYSQKQDAYFRTDLRISYRREMSKSTLEVAVDLQNVSANKNVFQQTYNPRTNSLATVYQQGFFPVPMVRFTF